MPTIRNKERTSVFPLLTIDIDKVRGRWRVFVGDRRVGRLYERKVQAMRAVRRIRKAWTKGVATTYSKDHQLLQAIESHFHLIAASVHDCDSLDGDD